MVRDVDRWLGRDLVFNRADECGTVQTPVTVAAWDPTKGWRLWSRFMNPAWIPADMFERLLREGVLEEPASKFGVLLAMTVNCLHCGIVRVDSIVNAARITRVLSMQPGTCNAIITCPRCGEEVHRADVTLTGAELKGRE